MDKEIESLRYRILEFMRTPQDTKEVLLAILVLIQGIDARITEDRGDLEYHRHHESGSSTLVQEWD